MNSFSLFKVHHFALHNYYRIKWKCYMFHTLGNAKSPAFLKLSRAEKTKN